MANIAKKRKISEDLESFFEYDDSLKKSQCKLCKKKVTGHHRGNLIRHLHSFISETGAHQALLNNESFERLRSEKISDRLRGSNNTKDDVNSIINACVALVTINARPFSMLDDSGFQQIINLALGDASQEVINSRNIPKYISKAAEQMREHIREEIDGKMVSIKIDGVTRQGRSIMGVNIQFVMNGEIQVRTLAMKTIEQAHTGTYKNKYFCFYFVRRRINYSRTIIFGRSFYLSLTTFLFFSN